MSNHLTQYDQIALKVNEIIRTVNLMGRAYPIEPLTCAPPIEDPLKPIDYPEYNKAKPSFTGG